MNFMADNRTSEAALAGFSDSKGDYAVNLDLSCKRANVLKEELESRGITVINTLCLGEEMPIASNTTKQGQEKNRRVEVWIK